MLPESAATAVVPAAAVCLQLLTRWRGKNGSIVGVVEHEEPRPILLVAEPVVDQLEHIDVRILAATDLDLICYLPVALLESCCVTGVRPEDPRLWRLLGDAEAVLDS